MRVNQILFYYDFILKINHKVIQESHNYFNVYWYRNKEELDRIEKKAYRICKLYK